MNDNIVCWIKPVKFTYFFACMQSINVENLKILKILKQINAFCSLVIEVIHSLENVSKM